jgi:hypothetical protein
MITGYWAKSDGSRSKVHLVEGGKPICGVRMSKYAEYQGVATGASMRQVECDRCWSSTKRPLPPCGGKEEA